MKIGFVYGGQGSQLEKMGEDLYLNYGYIKDFYDSIGLDFPLKEMAFGGSLEEISKTRYGQAIITSFQISITEILRRNNILPSLAMGLSLGEYAALYAGGVLDRDQVLGLVNERSKYMGQLEEEIDSKMFALLTDDIDLVQGLCKSLSGLDRVEVSNINTRGQIVVSGQEKLVVELVDLLKEKNIRGLELNTSGAFHTSYMDRVSRKLEKLFEDMEFKEAKIPIIYNYSGDFEKENIKLIMAKQVNHTVLFKKSLEKLLDQDLDLIIEIGYGNVIKNFIRKLNRQVRVLSVNNLDSINNLIEEVGKWKKD